MRKSLPLAVTLACLCAVSAFSQETARSTMPKATKSPTVPNETGAQAAQDYWTPERLASALPMPLPRVDSAAVRGKHAASSAEPMRFGAGGSPLVHLNPAPDNMLERFPLNPGPEVTAMAAPRPDGFSYERPFNNSRAAESDFYPYATVGKLFFVIPDGASQPAGDYVCSGAVALDNHTVVTARQCMYDVAAKKWYSGWAFYPGWDNGPNSALGGRWDVSFAYTWTGGAPNYYYDIGLLAMHDSTGTGCGGSQGRTIGSLTGWLGYTYNGNYAQRQWSIFGYPQAAPFEGNYLFEDTVETGAVNPLGATDIVEVGNPQTSGASGGPWILGFDAKSRGGPGPVNNTSGAAVNLINGLNSFKWIDPNQAYSMNGPAFQTANFWNLYLSYQKERCM